MTGPATHCGFAAIIGAPNAGKSTLINTLVGGKVSIVSPRPQTTRTTVRGLVVHKNTQIIFIDTPGLFAPKRRLERAMVAAAWTGRDEADMAVLVVDAAQRKIDDDTRNIVDRLKKEGDKRPCVIVLNKTDAVDRGKLLPLAQELNALYPFAATFMISALKDDGTNGLLDWLAEHLPTGPFLYPEDQMTDMPLRLLAAEITREKLFYRLRDELPHAVSVETESWDQRDDGSIAVGQIIFVARENHRPIILGKGGQSLKETGIQSRKELEDITGRRVHLKLFVKLRGNWADDPEHYRTWGLDYQS